MTKVLMYRVTESYPPFREETKHYHTTCADLLNRRLRARLDIHRLKATPRESVCELCEKG